MSKTVLNLTSFKDELSVFLRDNNLDRNDIFCAELSFDQKDVTRLDREPSTGRENILLRIGYTPENMTEFMERVTFWYSLNYAGQKIFGTLWFKDGSWAERYEENGWEEWRYYTRPDVPDYLHVDTQSQRLIMTTN